MLTRKPSAAAPAAYPTGKESRAATPPRAPAPAGPRAARVQPSWRGRPPPAGPRTKSAPRRGPRADGAPSPRLRSVHCCTPAPGLHRVEPSTRPAGAVPGHPPTPSPGAWRGHRALVGGPVLFPACGRLQRGPPSPGPARLQRGVANSRAGARLNFAAA